MKGDKCPLKRMIYMIRMNDKLMKIWRNNKWMKIKLLI